MSTIVVDADGLIKIGKSGALPALLGATGVLVPQTVWEEAVEEGKRRMYEDAQVLERSLGEGSAEVVGEERSRAAEELLQRSRAYFGAGERAALAVFFARGADAILTDDGAFLRLLAVARPPVPALVPTAAIVGLAETGRLSVEAAREALERIEPYVRAGAYEAAMNELNEISERSSTKDGQEQGG